MRILEILRHDDISAPPDLAGEARETWHSNTAAILCNAVRDHVGTYYVRKAHSALTALLEREALLGQGKLSPVRTLVATTAASDPEAARIVCEDVLADLKLAMHAGLPVTGNGLISAACLVSMPPRVRLEAFKVIRAALTGERADDLLTPQDEPDLPCLD